jgi:hypothetical protein
MTEHTDLITIRYELHNGDATKYALEPTPHVGIYEVLQARLIMGAWEVTSTEPGTHPSWVGHGGYKQEAILDYLKARLGMVKE